MLERSSHQVRLTVAGEALLDEGRRALEAVRASLLRDGRADVALLHPPHEDLWASTPKP